MGLFDSLKRMAESTVKREVNSVVNKTVNNAVNKAADSIGKGRNYTETFSFASIPATAAELQAIPEATLDSAFKTAAGRA